MLKNNNLYLVIFIVFFVSCSSTEENEQDNENSSDTNHISNINISDKIFSIPSPIQASLVINNTGIPFESSFLNSLENSNNYASNLQKSLNLGIYSADLGYLNIYNQLEDANLYFAEIKKLLVDLKLENILEEKTLKNLEQSIKERDRNYLVYSKSLKEINKYLNNNNKNDITIFIIIGGWIESLHFLLQNHLVFPENKVLKTYIAEQKISLENIVSIIGTYHKKYSEELDILIEKLIDFAYDFDAIELSYEYKKTKMDTSNNLIVINSKAEAFIKDKDLLKRMSNKLAKIRLSIIE